MRAGGGRQIQPLLFNFNPGSVYLMTMVLLTRHALDKHGQLFLPDLGQLIMYIQNFKFHHLQDKERYVTSQSTTRSDPEYGRRKFVS